MASTQSTQKIGSVWSEIDPRIVQDGQGRLKVVENAAAVMASIDNILRTAPGERVMLPQFGSNLRGLVFESITPTLMKFMSRQVKDAIEAWDDRVLVQEVELTTDPDRNQISVTVLFNIRGYGNIFEYKASVGSGI